MRALRLALAALLVAGSAFLPVAGSALAGPLPTPFRGTVSEVIVTGEYMFIRVKTAKGEEWIAATEQPLAAGNSIAWSEGASMPNFHSKRLNRTFDTITFVDVVVRTN